MTQPKGAHRRWEDSMAREIDEILQTHTRGTSQPPVGSDAPPRIDSNAPKRVVLRKKAVDPAEILARSKSSAAPPRGSDSMRAEVEKTRGLGAARAPVAEDDEEFGDDDATLVADRKPELALTKLSEPAPRSQPPQALDSGNTATLQREVGRTKPETPVAKAPTPSKAPAASAAKAPPVLPIQKPARKGTWGWKVGVLLVLLGALAGGFYAGKRGWLSQWIPLEAPKAKPQSISNDVRPPTAKVEPPPTEPSAAPPAAKVEPPPTEPSAAVSAAAPPASALPKAPGVVQAGPVAVAPQQPPVAQPPAQPPVAAATPAPAAVATPKAAPSGKPMSDAEKAAADLLKRSLQEHPL